MKKEKWVPIIGYNGLYKISTFGRIKSLSRKRYTNRDINKKYRYKQKISIEKILKPIKKSIGYYQITLTKESNQKILSIHRLVAKHFIDNNNNKPQINHKDGNGLNNNISNLEWCNASENGLHSYRILKNTVWHKGNTGKNTPTSKPVLQKDFNGNIIKKWDCGMDAVREKNFDSGCISRCCNGINKSHKDFLWEYAK